MKKLLLCTFLISISFLLRAQDKGYLTSDKDSTSLSLKLTKKNGEQKVYVQFMSSGYWNEIYPENAKVACVPGKKMYVSIKLPDKDKYVWMRCFFNGKDQLLSYKDEYYVRQNGTLYRLKNNTNSEGKIGAKLFVGQMIALYNSKVDFDFTRLFYEASSISEPIRKYHEEKGIEFQDFNKYVEVYNFRSIKLESSLYQLRVNGLIDNPININGYGFGVNGGITFSNSRLPKLLSFYVGLGLGYLPISSTVKSSYSNWDSYYTIKSNGVTFSLPVMVSLSVVRSSAIQMSLQSGINFNGYRWGKATVRVETERSGVVTTELNHYKPKFPVYVGHLTELILSSSRVSKNFSLGAAYNYQLVTGGDLMLLDCENSKTFFVRYLF